MPYHAYERMDREDIYSIIVYLRSLPAVEKEIPDSKADFPMNFIMHTMPAKAQFTVLPDTIDRLAYGKYLVIAAACIDCQKI